MSDAVSDDLVKRLRAWHSPSDDLALCNEAADRIERLAFEIDTLIWSIRASNGEHLEPPERPASVLRAHSAPCRICGVPGHDPFNHGIAEKLSGLSSETADPMNSERAVPDRLTHPISGWWRAKPKPMPSDDGWLVLVFDGRIAATNGPGIVGAAASTWFARWWHFGWSIEFDGRGAPSL